jgi:hypothetical protein
MTLIFTPFGPGVENFDRRDTLPVWLGGHDVSLLEARYRPERHRHLMTIIRLRALAKFGKLAQCHLA